MHHRTSRRGRSFAVAAVVALAIVGVGCSSESDDGSSATAAEDSLDESTPTEPVAVDAETASSDTTSADAGGDETAGDAECDGLSAAAVGAAVGAGDFDSADDISIDADTTCLFTNSMSTYGVSVSKESASTFLAGELDGASPDDALSSLEILFTSSIDDATVTRTDVGGNAAIVVTGTLLSGGPAGKAGAVVDGFAVVVEADGSDLAPDAAGFEPIVVNVLALATSS